MTPSQKVKQIIYDHLDGNYGEYRDRILSSADIEDNMTLLDLWADSLDRAGIVIFTAQEFNIEIPDAEAEKWRTVGDVVGYVESVIA